MKQNRFTLFGARFIFLFIASLGVYKLTNDIRHLQFDKWTYIEVTGLSLFMVFYNATRKNTKKETGL